MPVIINQICGGLDESEAAVIQKALRAVGLSSRDVKKAGINKVSLDARKRGSIHFVYSVYAEPADERTEKRLLGNKRCRPVPHAEIHPVISDKKRNGEIVIAGFGPAGMFCGLVLARNGYRPVILERGADVDRRIKDVSSYWSGGELNLNSNVQFGEGGAGTFSDGKLTTRINDPLCRYVLEEFVRFGAPEEILIKAKPHIGTDNLRSIVRALREEIISLGGRVLFDSRLDDIRLRDNSISSIVYNNSTEIETAAAVLAVGHSARDTFEMLLNRQVFMQSKPFSAGVRIEHRQRAVDESLYGSLAGSPLLPAGEYQLSHRRSDGRCVYTFCMCPGGHVVPAASEAGTVVTNGMSSFARDGENANAALVVSVSEKDYGSGILAGMEFARKIEQQAFATVQGGKTAPATTVRGFLDGTPSLKTGIVPTYDRGLHPCSFEEIFPKSITDMMREGLGVFSGKMHCFSDGDALLTAPETRTSSPVRITRTEQFNSVSAENLYPCGEGAGYAGGIMSAAVDGVKTALAVMSRVGR
ncbi:MAG: NAD(P)/FAD-dependent oxidoreductase [Porcipelethomonas sp.]